ncbi:hypothetical protein GCM10025786_02200 [Nocardioides caeni]
MLLLGSAAAFGAWWLQREPDHPDKWDPRVVEFVDFVEDERGLDFEHPVYVDFLTDEEFDKEVSSDDSELTDEDREEIQQSEGILRALGLLPHDVDLLDATNDLLTGAVIGLYDPEDKRIRMRGTKLTPEVRSTLVHELTHALQDQHFDLEEKADEHEESDDSSAAAVWSAIVEGDADRVEDAWAESLSPEDRKELTRAQADQSRDAADDLADVPPFLTTLIGSSYALGSILLGLADELDGTDGIDDLFSDPPVSEEALVDPWTALVDDESATSVDEPDIPDGAEEIDAGTFGSPSLLFVLAERISPQVALGAADGWGGDHYVAYEQDDRTCIRVDYVGDSRRDVTELRSALRSWIAEGPGGTASVSDHDEGLRFESCDPGERSRAGNGGSADALQLAAARGQIAIEVLPGGAPEEFARCYADVLVRELSIAELSSSQASSELQSRVESLAQRCL